MKSADRHILLLLDDIEAAVGELRRVYPEAVISAESVRFNRQGSGVPIRSSGISDPTGDTATDPRRQRRQSNLKRARRQIRSSLNAARSAVAHSVMACD